MSAAIYSRLLDEFRKGSVESGHALFNLEIRSPVHFSRGWEPSESATVNYRIEELVASVSLGSSEAVAIVRKRADESETEWPTKDQIEKFKRLCSEAGAALPLVIRDRLPEQSWIYRDPAKWWIVLLACLHGATVNDAEGRYQEKQFLLPFGSANPWEASALAIEYLRLNTDSPEWPEEETGGTTKTANASANRVSLDAKALAVFFEHPQWKKKQIAEHLGTNPKSLTPKRCPKLAAAIAAYKAPELRRGSKDADGNIEAWEG